jgi:hypothetical protein
MAVVRSAYICRRSVASVISFGDTSRRQPRYCSERHITGVHGLISADLAIKMMGGAFPF